MRKKQSILYVNFSPYENAGNILDYLLETFDTVVLFSFRFHTLKENTTSDTITLYKKGEVMWQRRMLAPPVISSMTFYLLPIRSFVILIQLFIYAVWLRRAQGMFDIFFTVNAYTAWLGNILRFFGIVRKTIFWVWDYYPPVHKDPIVRVMRFLYWQFDKPASLHADKTVFLNKRLAVLRNRMGIRTASQTTHIIPIGTNPVHRLPKTGQTLRLVFFGVLKTSQGLDSVFAASSLISRKYPNAELHIIGDGPDRKRFQTLAHGCPIKTIFYGYVQADRDIRKIISSCDIGLAPYMPDISNVSYYTDPSKIKTYLSLGVPTIMTDFLTFSQEITSYRAGVVLKNVSPKSLVAAISQIVSKRESFRRNALSLARRFSYKRLYPKLFS